MIGLVIAALRRDGWDGMVKALVVGLPTPTAEPSPAAVISRCGLLTCEWDATVLIVVGSHFRGIVWEAPTCPIHIDLFWRMACGEVANRKPLGRYRRPRYGPVPPVTYEVGSGADFALKASVERLAMRANARAATPETPQLD